MHHHNHNGGVTHNNMAARCVIYAWHSVCVCVCVCVCFPEQNITLTQPPLPPPSKALCLQTCFPQVRISKENDE